MPIDFAPPQPNAQPFNIAPVQYTDPLQTLAQMGQLRTQALQQQNAQMQLQQAQLAYKSNQAMMQAFAQGNGDWDATQKLLDSSADILPSDRMAVEQHRVQLQQSYANLTKDQQAIHQWNAEKYRANLDGVIDQDSLDQANLKSAREGVSFSDPNAAGGATTGVPQLTTFTDAPHVKAYGNSLVLPAQIAEEELKKSQASEATARGQQATAEQQKLAAETDILQQKQRLYKIFSGAPQALNEWVNSSIDPVKFPAANAAAKNEMRYAGDLDKMTEILQKYSASPVSAELEKVQVPTKVEQARQTEQATAPIKTAQSVATAQQTAPIETAKSVATAVQTEQGKASLLPDPWRTLDPTTGREGLNKSLTLDQKYTDSMAKAQNTLNTIQAALKGNQRAASFVTIEQLRSQLNRVTGTEIAATDAGGSLIRRIQNDISSKFQGRPYSETLKDSIALANLEKTAAENEYAGGQAALSNNYKIGPLPHAALPRGVSPAPGRGIPAGKVGVKLKSGNTATFDTQAQADKFRKDHPNLVQ